MKKTLTIISYFAYFVLGIMLLSSCSISSTESATASPTQTSLDSSHTMTAVNTTSTLSTPVDYSTVTPIAGRTLEESEYYHIPITKEFIIENGNSIDAINIKLTFPESWLTQPPPIFDGAIILRVPIVFVTEHDMDKSPDIVTSYYFRVFFQGIEQYTSSEPDKIHMTLSLEWILRNNISIEPDTVKVTFPITWLTSPPPVPDGETPFEFDVDMKQFRQVAGQENPDSVTVVFLREYFEGHTNVAPIILPGVPTPQIYFDPPAINFYTKPGTDPPSENTIISVIDAPLDWSFNWSLSCDVPWLEVSKTSGRAFRFGETVWLRPHVNELAAGMHTATVTLTGDKLNKPRTFTVKIFITDTEINQTPDINIEPALGTYLTPGILIESAAVFVDTLDRRAQNGWSSETYNPGDPCYVVKGTMKNDTDTNWQVCFHAEGYDSSGIEVSRTLDVELGPLAGLIAFNISAHSSHEFTIHMNWAENITLIKIAANTYDPKTPLP